MATVSAALLALTLAACSSESDSSGTVPSAQAGADRGTDDEAEPGNDASSEDGADGSDSVNDATQDSLDRGLRHPDLFAGIPLIDGETTHDIAGTLSKGGTDYEDFGVDTGQPWQDVADQVHSALKGTDFTEKAWAVSDVDSGTGKALARGLFSQGDRVLKLEVDPDGEVSYDVREMPSGSFAEQDFACQELQTFAVTGPMLPTMVPLTTGEPVTAEQVDFAYAYLGGLADRLPAEVADSAAGLHDALGGTVGKRPDQLTSGSAPMTAVDDAQTALSETRSAYCQG